MTVQTKIPATFASDAVELAELRRTLRQLFHPIVARGLTGRVGDRVGECFLCGRVIWETGDYRGDRFRHRGIDE